MGAGSANADVRRLPLGPALAVPLALLFGLGTLLGTTLVAGLPLLFGALMRPLGASLSAAAGAFTLVCYDLTLRDGCFVDGSPYAELPYSGARLDVFADRVRGRRPARLSRRGTCSTSPSCRSCSLLWAAMAGVVSLAEWAGRPVRRARGRGGRGSRRVRAARLPESRSGTLVSEL